MGTPHLTLRKLWARKRTRHTRDAHFRTIALTRSRRKRAGGFTVNPGFGLWAVIALRFERVTNMEPVTNDAIAMEAPNRNALGQSAPVAFTTTHTIKAGEEKPYEPWPAALAEAFSRSP